MLLLFRLQNKGEDVPKRSRTQKKNEKKKKNARTGCAGGEGYLGKNLSTHRQLTEAFDQLHPLFYQILLLWYFYG